MKQMEGDYIVRADGPNWLQTATENLREKGVVVVRGLMPDEDVATLATKANRVLARPSISGSVGYYMKDPNKKMYDCYLLGREAIGAVTNSKLVDLLESFFGKEVVMTEGFLKHDNGNGRSYFPYHSHTGQDVVKDGDGPFGCGMMVYLHDTDVGAFCYCPGTQHWNSPHGADPYQYPAELRQKIESGMRRISGKKGDFVIFDNRGFHGPEQPVDIPRTVLLTGYNPIAYCRNGTIKNGAPILITDLTGLDARALRVMGVGLKAATPYEKHHFYSFNKTRGFRIMSRMLDLWFTVMLVRERMTDRIRAMRGRKVAYDAGDV